MNYSVRLREILYLGVHRKCLQVWLEVVLKDELKVNQAQKVGRIISGYQSLLQNGANFLFTEK